MPRRGQKAVCLALMLCLSCFLCMPVYGLAAETPLNGAVSVSMDQPQTLRGALDEGCKSRLYRLDIEETGTLTYQLEFQIQAIDLRLFNENGQPVRTWYLRWDEDLRQGSREIRFSAESGVYYLQIKRRGGEGAYTLTQTFAVEKTTELQPNETLEQAQPLALGQTAYGVIAVGFEKNARDRDVYRLDVSKTKNITFDLRSKLPAAYLHIYDAEGGEIRYAFAAADKNTSQNRISRTYRLPAGRYYLLVKGGSDTGAYTLRAAAAVLPGQTAVTSLARRSVWQNLRVRLKQVKGADGYEIWTADNARFQKAAKYRKTKLSASFHMPKGKTWYVKARAYKKNSEGGRMYGRFSKVKKIRL